jgi:hypothetical protein
MTTGSSGSFSKSESCSLSGFISVFSYAGIKNFIANKVLLELLAA